MNFRKQILSCALALIPVCGVFAQSSESLGFVRINQNAALQGTAGAAFTSAKSPAWSSMGDITATLDSEAKLAAGLGYNLWSATGTSYASAGVSYKASDKLAFALSGVYGLEKSYDIYNTSGVKRGTFTPSQMLVSVGAAYRVLPMLSLGVTLHGASETLAEGQSYSAFSADVLVSANFSGLKATAGVVSLGSKVKDAAGNAFSLPGSVKLAAGYEGCSLGILSYGAYLDSGYYLASGTLGLSVGGSLGYQDLVALRAGYHYGSGKCVIPSYGSVGLGGGFKGLSLDLAYLFGGQISGTLMVNLGYRF